MNQSKKVIAIALVLAFTNLKLKSAGGSPDNPQSEVQFSKGQVYEVKGHVAGSPTFSNHISPDSSRIVSTDKQTGKSLYIQLLITGELIKSFQHERPIDWAQWISNNQIMFGSRDNEQKIAIFIWNI